MPKAAAPTDRDHRVLVRNMAQMARQLLQNEQKFKAFKKKSAEKEIAHVKRREEDAEILKNSLRNFSGPFYKQKYELQKKKKEVNMLRTEIQRLRQNARKNLVALRGAVQKRIESRKTRSCAPMSAKYVVKARMDI